MLARTWRELVVMVGVTRPYKTQTRRALTYLLTRSRIPIITRKRVDMVKFVKRTSELSLLSVLFLLSSLCVKDLTDLLSLLLLIS